MSRSDFEVSNSHPSVTMLVIVAGLAVCQFHGVSWSADESAPIVIRGSSTLQPIVANWADHFGREDCAIAFDIVANGTSKGIEDLLLGRADIAMASRPMSEEELAAARDKGLAVRTTIVARMGIAVIINQENPVSSLSISKVAQVFSGGLRSWQSVGGPEQPIIVVRKESGWSPEFFRRRVMGDLEYVEEAVVVDSKEEVVAEVSNRPWSIGVTGMPEAIPALGQISLVRLVSDISDEDATYALSRPLFVFTVKKSQAIRDFLDYVVGESAQAMIIETGFYTADQADSMSKE